MEKLLYVTFGFALIANAYTSVKLVKSCKKFNKTMKDIDFYELRKDANMLYDEVLVRKSTE